MKKILLIIQRINKKLEKVDSYILYAWSVLLLVLSSLILFFSSR